MRDYVYTHGLELPSARSEKLLSAMGGSNCRDSELARVMKVSDRGMLGHKWDICATTTPPPRKAQGAEQDKQWVPGGPVLTIAYPTPRK